MVLPEPGFHAGLRRLTRETGTLLLIDETHTISTGPGGYTRAYGLEPDLFVVGNAITRGKPGSDFLRPLTYGPLGLMDISHGKGSGHAKKSALLGCAM